jgi:SAM-dependent methyltransferase
MNFAFDEKKNTSLCEIMGRNGSDKGNVNILESWHNYTPFYSSTFKHLCDKQIRLFELGLGTNNVNLPSNMGKDGRPGASHYGWAEFFPISEIFGADIDSNILFNTDRIKTYYCDQRNPAVIKNMWNYPELQENFDIIIEDGLHEFHANVCFFENSIHKLKPNGYYIIEDILLRDEILFKNKMIEWEMLYKTCSFTLLKIPSSVNHSDNTLLVVYKSEDS